MLFVPAFLTGRRKAISGREAILAAARTTPYYRKLKLNDLSDAVPVSLAQLRADPELFRNPDASAGTPRDFEHPQKYPPKTLLFEEGFRPAPGLLMCKREWRPNGAEPAAGSLVAARGTLVSLAAARTVPVLTHSIVALVGPEFGALTPADRDLLWARFGVPIYEQFRGLGKELLAAECDAHEGLHIREEDAIFEEGDELLVTSLTNLANPMLRLRTGLRGRITTKLCGCGETGRRLLGLEAIAGEEPRAAAAG